MFKFPPAVLTFLIHVSSGEAQPEHALTHTHTHTCTRWRPERPSDRLCGAGRKAQELTGCLQARKAAASPNALGEKGVTAQTGILLSLK